MWITAIVIYHIYRNTLTKVGLEAVNSHIQKGA